MSYYAPITTTELDAVKETATCYFAYVTNIIRKARERGISYDKYYSFRRELGAIRNALNSWQQSPDGSTDLYDNPYSVADLNGMIGWIRVNCGSGCINVPEDEGNQYIVVLDLLTDYGDYIAP